MIREGFITTLCKYSQSLRILEKALNNSELYEKRLQNK